MLPPGVGTISAMAKHHAVKDEHLDSRLRCPHDARLMEKVAIGDFTIDRCAGCGGMWFDARELGKVLTSKHGVEKLDIGAVVKSNASGSLGELHCPRDKSLLITTTDTTQSHIHMDACTVCGGVFLNAGELQDLSEVTLKERLRSLFKRS